MLLFKFSLIGALLHSIAPSVASPLTVPLSNTSLTRRDEYCANAPNTKAGSPLNRRSDLSSILHSRVPPGTMWCASHSSTFISVTLIHPIPPSASGLSNVVLETIQAALDITRSHISLYGDGVIGLNGGYTAVGSGGIRLTAWNANNHQITWGVLCAAMGALKDFMRVQNWYGAVTFDIYDGVNRVASAFLA